MVSSTVRHTGEAHQSTTKLPWLSSLGPVLLAMQVSGVFLAGTAAFRWMPITLSALLNIAVPVWTVAIIAYHQLSRGSRGRHVRPPSSRRWPLAMPLVLLTLSLLLSAGSTIPGDYSSRKVFLFLAVTVPLLVTPWVLVRDESRQKPFYSSLIALSALGVILLVADPEAVSDATDIAVIDGTNSIGSARLIGTGVVLCVTHLLLARSWRFREITLSALGLLLLWGMISTGSRGPFLSVAFALIAVVATMVLRNRVRIRTAFVLTALAAGVVFVLQRANSDGWERIFGYIEGARDNSTATRDWLWQTSFDFIATSPLGLGFGNFSALAAYPYPHNIVVEVFVEGGWIAGGLLCLVLLLALVQAFRKSTSPVGYATLALLVFTLANAMVSGDVNDNRLLWVVIVIALMPKLKKAPITNVS